MRQWDNKRLAQARQQKRIYQTYDKRWRAIRESILNEQPLCATCKALGHLAAANVVDHVDGDATNNDRSNLMALCSSYHSRKTANAEVYSGATTEKQAWEVFRPAKIMLQNRPELKQRAGIEFNASNMIRLADGSRFEPVIGRPGDGQSPSCGIVDELHEHKTSELFDTMITGMGARAQPLILAVTTAGFNIGGPCYQLDRDVSKCSKAL